MKLTKVVALLSALMVLLTLVGCPDTTNSPKQNPNVPDDGETWQPVPVVDGTKTATGKRLSVYAAKGDPVLPSGTLKDIAKWDVAPNGKQGLPDFITKLQGDLTTPSSKKMTSITNVTPELKKALKEAQETPGFFAEKPRNIIFIISDGMGEPQVKMSREYKGELIMDSIAIHRGVDHRSFKKADKAENVTDKKTLITTDSCAGGTAMLSGYKTRYGYIGLDREANQIPTLAELAKKLGKKIGCVTNDCTQDATPADTLVHSSVRSCTDSCYVQMSLFGPDVVIGGYTDIKKYANKGVNFLSVIAKQNTSDDTDGWDMSVGDGVAKAITVSSWWDQYKSGNYGNMLAKTLYNDDKYFADKDEAWFEDHFAKQNYAFYSENWSGMITAAQDPAKKPILYVNSAAPGEITSSSWEFGFALANKQKPSFPEMVAYTVGTLYNQDKNDANSNGFFCMIENTVTDGWGHYDVRSIKKSSPAADGGDKIEGENIKAAFCANEVQNTDEGVAIAIKFVLEHPDTLLVVSADHDTGGLKFEKGWESDYEKVWSSTDGHSSAMVPIYAVGAGADIFTKDLKGNAIADIPLYDIMTTNIIETPDKTDYINYYTGAKIGELMGDPNFGCRQNGDPRYGGYEN